MNEYKAELEAERTKEEEFVKQQGGYDKRDCREV